MAAALQRPAGRVSVRYTLPASPTGPPHMDRMLMRTPCKLVVEVRDQHDVRVRPSRASWRAPGAG